MRIAFHVPRAASFLGPATSGDTTNVRNLIAGLTSLGHEVSIVSRLNVRDLWRGRISAWGMAREAWRVRREMARFAPDAWLVYGASVTNPDLFGWWQCRGRYVLVNTSVGRGRRLSSRWRPLFRFVHRRSLARADSVVAERPPHADELRRFGVPTDRLSLLPSPAGGLGQVPSQDQARTRLSLPSDAPVIVCITRMPPLGDDEDRGKTGAVLDLLAAFSDLPAKCLLVLVGDGPGLAPVEAEIARRGLGARVRLVGSVPHDELVWFYAACDLYAYPVPADRGLVAIVEAQAAGRPVVTMRTPTTETLVAEERTGFLADDLPAFGAHLAALAGDRARSAAMGHTALAYAATHHSIETRLREIEALLLGTVTRTMPPIQRVVTPFLDRSPGPADGSQ